MIRFQFEKTPAVLNQIQVHRLINADTKTIRTWQFQNADLVPEISIDFFNYVPVSDGLFEFSIVDYERLKLGKINLADARGDINLDLNFLFDSDAKEFLSLDFDVFGSIYHFDYTDCRYRSE